MDAAPGAGRLYARGLATSAGRDAGKAIQHSCGAIEAQLRLAPPTFDRLQLQSCLGLGLSIF